MKKKRNTRRPFTSPLPWLLAALVGVGLAVGIDTALRRALLRPAVISAYGVSICGVSHHVVLIYGDGRQRIVKGADILTDKETVKAVETLPENKAAAFNVCPKAPPLKIY